MRVFLAALLCAQFVLGPAPTLARRHDAATSGRALVAHIDARLTQYVRPTGKCPPGTSEKLATFYWSGRRTATGELFNPNGHSVAVKKSSGIAFGRYLTITNPHNGRSVVVRVNDRGPATIADIDLSRGAARFIGLKQSSYICMSGV